MINLEVRPVKNKQELEDMFYQRWLVLRSPLGMELGSERDSHEYSAIQIVATLDRKIIGSGRLRELSPELGSIAYLAVLPEFQHRGVGTKLIEKLILQSREKHLKTVRVMSRINAVKFYQNLGFLTENKSCEYLGIPHVFMQLKI